MSDCTRLGVHTRVCGRDGAPGMLRAPGSVLSVLLKDPPRLSLCLVCALWECGESLLCGVSPEITSPGVRIFLSHPSQLWLWLWLPNVGPSLLFRAGPSAPATAILRAPHTDVSCEQGEQISHCTPSTGCIVQSTGRFWPFPGCSLPTAAGRGLPGGPGCQARRGLPRPPARGCLCGTSSLPAAPGPRPRAGGGIIPWDGWGLSHLPASPEVLPAPETFT